MCKCSPPCGGIVLDGNNGAQTIPPECRDPESLDRTISSHPCDEVEGKKPGGTGCGCNRKL